MHIIKYLCPQFPAFAPWRNASLHGTRAFTTSLHFCSPVICHRVVETAVLIPWWAYHPSRCALSFLCIYVLNFKLYLLTVEGEGQAFLQEMRRDRIIQRFVLVDERSIMGSFICPFQKSHLKYIHLQRVLSTAVPVKCPKTYAAIPGDAVT